jgi:copper(I)-binding protein
MKHVLILLAAFMFGNAAHSHDYIVGELEITHPMIPATVPGARSAAGYVVITNNGAQMERLLGVETPAPMSMLHKTEFGSDGIARMMHLEAVEIAPGDSVIFEPGGMHVMLMGLTTPFLDGQMVPATLIFERAGRIDVEFMVHALDASGASAMMEGAGGHNH